MILANSINDAIKPIFFIINLFTYEIFKIASIIFMYYGLLIVNDFIMEYFNEKYEAKSLPY
jgi:hypothetical protein